jgi:hypothetical protein
MLEGRLVPTNYLWINNGGGNFSAPANWIDIDKPDEAVQVAPGANDSIEFDTGKAVGGFVGGNGTCTIDVALEVRQFKVRTTYANN